MLISNTGSGRIALGIIVLAAALAPAMITAQDENTSAANTNPTGILISPRKNQSEEQQLSDQSECYAWTCDQIEWDPYEAYDALVDEGYALALTKSEMEQGLIGLAEQGAVTGAIADDLIDGPGDGAEIGAAIAVASGLLHSNYLYELDDPVAQRVVSRFERNLRKWERKFSGCMSRKGYRIPSS